MQNLDKIKSLFDKNFVEHKLHHSLILQGNDSIALLEFAKKFIFEKLNCKENFHPDLLIIEKEENKKEISVKQIRKIADFSHQTSSSNSNKFIIINQIDELNKSSANALLKILEEPGFGQSSYFISISNNLSRVFLTIKSRCLIYKVKSPDFTEFKNYFFGKFNEEEILFLSEIYQNSINKTEKEGANLL